MRKLLLLVALLPAMNMMGERTAREAIQEAAANAVTCVDAQVRNVEMTQPGDPAISLSPDVKATVRLSPFYKRPAGSFYVCQLGGTRDLVTPFLAVAPAAATNFDDATYYVPSGTTRQWRVQLTDWYSVQGNEMPPLKWFTVNDNDRYGLAVQYENNEVDSVPELDLTYQGRTFDYKMQSVRVDDIMTPTDIEYDCHSQLE